MKAGTGHSMETRRYWNYAMVAGLLTLAASLWLFSLFPSDFAKPSTEFRDPIVAFEFAQTKQDLLEIFGAAGDPARLRRQDAMDEGHRADWAFLILYNLFIASFFVALYKRTGRKLMLAGVAVAAIAALGDIWENSVLRELTWQLENPDTLLLVLSKATWVKWGALGFGAGLCAYGFYKDGRYILALTAVPGALMVVPAFLEPRLCATILADAIGLWFLVMLMGAFLYARNSHEYQEPVAEHCH